MVDLILGARELLDGGKIEDAYNLLAPHLNKNLENISFLQIFAETLLENDDIEKAFEVLNLACALDPDANFGTDKFFNLGQMVGGREGLCYLDRGLYNLNSQLEKLHNSPQDLKQNLIETNMLHNSKEELQRFFTKKLNQGIFAKIEIWMTDLCMEEEAENQCEQLINYSLGYDGENPEALSLLASIRISQLRIEEAVSALTKSWSLYQERQAQLEANQSRHQDMGFEYAELVQPLLNLSRLAIELELYDIAIAAASTVQDLNEDILEPHYYEALSYILLAKKAFQKIQDNGNDYRVLELQEIKNCENSEIKVLLDDAKSSLTQAYKIIQSEISDADEELVEQVLSLLDELDGPLISELMPPKKADAELEGWEDEIESDKDS